jgi:hypothetical protein
LDWEKVCLYLKLTELDTIKKFFSAITINDDYILEIIVRSEKVTFKSFKKIDKNDYLKLVLNSSKKY